MDEKTKSPEFCEDSFDLGAHRKAARVLSRKKTDAKRAKRNISFGKALLTIAALAVFISLFFAVMHVLQLGAV